MLGERRGGQGALFYDFSLERHVPADHMLRAIDRFVDFGEVRGRLAPFYSSTGRGIEPPVCVFTNPKRTDGPFPPEHFTYDQEGDVYFSPAGKMLTCKGTVVNDNQLMYRASKYDCHACRLKPRCCPKEPARKIPRSIYEGAR